MSKGATSPVEYPAAVKAGLVLTALVSLWGAFEYASFESAYQQQSRDPYQVEAQFSRFAGFQAATPESAVLGYLTDLAPGSVTADAMFNGAQYALAPRLLRKDARADAVLGNFSKPADFVALGREQGLRIEQDFGNGVVLYRRDTH